jgi:hypothetical protein
VPSEGGNSEVEVQVTDTDAPDAAKNQLGRDHDQNFRENRSSEMGESNTNVASPVTSEPPKSSEGTPPPTTSSGTQQKTDTQSSKKKAADPQDSFEPWERELMEELLNDVKGHLGEQA